MKTFAFVSIASLVLAGCVDDSFSPIDVEQTSDGLRFSFSEKVHDIDVWRCSEGCDERALQEYGCGFPAATLAWGSSASDFFDLGKTSPRGEPAPIEAPIFYGEQPASAAHVSALVHPLTDGLYYVDATRWEDTCKDDEAPCWEQPFRACAYFKVEGSVVSPIAP